MTHDVRHDVRHDVTDRSDFYGVDAWNAALAAAEQAEAEGGNFHNTLAAELAKAGPKPEKNTSEEEDKETGD